jgi:hypothetical protein
MVKTAGKLATAGGDLGARSDKSFHIALNKCQGCQFELDDRYFVCYNSEAYSQSDYYRSEYKTQRRYR